MSATIPRMLRNTRLLDVLGAIVILLAIAPAFTAANTTPSTSAGEGTATVSGYTIADQDFALNGSDPTLIDVVTFTAAGSAEPEVAKAQFVDLAGFYDCTVSGGGSPWTITCVTDGLTAIGQLTVAATDAFDTILTD